MLNYLIKYNVNLSDRYETSCDLFIAQKLVILFKYVLLNIFTNNETTTHNK